MKKSLLIIVATLFAGTLFAQNMPRQQGNTQRALPPPLPVRQVSGIVKDSTDVTIPGAVVILKSPKDTMSTAANADGIFVFKNVKSNVFSLTVTSIGYHPYIKKYSMNDAVPRLTLDPVVMVSQSTSLKTVVVNGTPSIVYKVDTIEYKASDYKVRPNATLDELLKKMEGFEVGSDGSVTHQGQAITKIKLNGKDYATGDVAQGIQNLPADIIEKAQVVDDYGDQAAHTGIKSGDPAKILNVTTKADKSVGTTGRLTAQAGDHDRYNAQLFVQRINANQQIGLIGGVQNLVTGIASTGTQGGNGGTGGSPGTALRVNPTISYRDQFGPKVQINSSFGYTLNNRNSTSDSYGSTYSTLGNGIFTRSGTTQNNSNGRQANFELDYQIDSLNYLQVQPNYSYNTTESYATSSSDQVNNYTSGFEHKVTTGQTNSKSPTTSAGALVLFVHRFKTPNRSFSFQANYSHQNSQSNGENNNDIKNYADSTLHTVIKDSVVHLLTYQTNITNTTRISTTYTEPLGRYSRFEFNGQVQHNSHNTNSTQDSVGTDGSVRQLDRLSVIYNYATTDTKLNFNYRYQGTKVNLSLGTLLEPYHLTGTKLNSGVGADVTTSKNDFRLLPIFRFSYSWSRTQRLAINYTSNINEPNFQQIQPYTDRSDVNNIKVGNPDLRATLVNSIVLQYNNYFPNSRFNISVNGTGSYTDDEVTTNTLQLPQIISAAVGTPGTPGYKPAQVKYINIINYVNLTGDETIGGNYNISKQLSDRRYNLQLNGRIQYGYNTAMSNNQLYHQTSWEFNERFGPRINPSDNVEVNPYVSTDMSRSFSTTAGNPWSRQLTNSLGIDGRFYFLKTFNVHYDARKQLITLTSSTNVTPIGNNSPLVIDGGFQKEIGKKRQFTVTFDVYDILHQNNFIQQTVTATGLTNTVASSLSRYFLIGFRLNLQKWSGRPQRNGRDMQRRGDGSFIYN